MTPLKRLMNQISPLHNIDEGHPLLIYEMRRLPGRQGSVRLWRRALWGAGSGAFLAIVVMLLLFFPQMRLTGIVVDYVIAGAIAVLIASILFGFMLDYNASRVGLSAINSEMVTGRWEMLRITPLREESIISVKHALSQLRVWRSMWMVIGFRLCVVAIWALALLAWMIDDSRAILSMNGVRPTVLHSLPLLVIAVAATWEPMQRVRGMAALGLSVSARTGRDGIGGSLMMMGWLVSLWLVQLVLIIVLAIIGVPLWLLFGRLDATGTLSWMLVAMLGSAVYGGLFFIVQAYAIRATLRRLVIFSERLR